MLRGLSLALVLGGVLLGSGAVLGAHHSLSAEFDTNQPVEFTGTVLKVDWMNPHIYTHVEVEEEDGTKVVYKIEGGPPNALYRAGWRKDSLAAGTVVTVSGIRAKNPESPNIGDAEILSEDGESIFQRFGRPR